MASSCNLKKRELGFYNKVSGDSNSETYPSLITKILSLSIIVLILWAIVKTVQFLNTSLIVFCTKFSVYISILAVASSINTNLLFFNKALAIQSNYFSPTLKLPPPSAISVLSPSLSVKNFFRLHLIKVSSMLASECSCKGSILSLKFPSNS